MTGITDDMIEAGARALCEVVVHRKWDDQLAGSRQALRRNARVVLEAVLAGRTVVDLPEPDERTVHAYVTFWNDHPETLPQEERDALQKLASIRAARRRAAEVSGGVGGDPQ